MRDFIVVGAGIGGLAVAELLQRSGRSVLLLEAADTVCGESSARQQGWFHTGALYAAMPSGRHFRHLIGNLDDLLNYYSCFPNMNLSAGRFLLTRSNAGWFRNSTNYYFYASPRDPSIKLWQKPLWRLAILRAQTRLSWFETVDFTRELSPQVRTLSANFNLRRSLSRRRFDFAPGVVDRVLKSRDRTISTQILMSDLLKSFLSHGGELKTGASVEKIERGRVSDQAGGSHQAMHVIVAAGKDAGRLTGIKTQVWKSPLLVVKPCVADVNFAWMTMNVDKTFNHIHHRSQQGDYSLIGNAAFYGEDQQADESAIKAAMRGKAETVFGQPIDEAGSSLYFGYKTEMSDGPQARNYQYQIVEAENGVLAIPGKLSLAFSLAVNVCRHFGVDPVMELQHFDDQVACGSIGEPEHLRRFLKMP